MFLIAEQVALAYHLDKLQTSPPTLVGLSALPYFISFISGQKEAAR